MNEYRAARAHASAGFRISRPMLWALWLLIVATVPLSVRADNVQGQDTTSSATGACLTCHRSATPGIVADWQRSRHASITPAGGLAREGLARRISAAEVPDSLSDIVIGCAECHTLRADSHNDTYDHSSYRVHTVVTPQDCAVCHPDEKAQYGMNLMSHAHVNLARNELFAQLMHAINGTEVFSGDSLVIRAPDSLTTSQSCYFCHGTEVTVAGFSQRQTRFGEMTFPDLTGWPNRGVGRLNPDGSKGACTPCHARHQFAIEVARQPHTCSECHKGPDVPAYKVYRVSKHGNIFNSLKSTWDFEKVPWTVGEDFTAPTCAVCHMSLIDDEQGNVVARRTHQVSDRLYVRLFGLIYAHPHPRSPATHLIGNADGLPLPTELDGGLAADALISEAEQARRKEALQEVCQACHSNQWVEKHFNMLDDVNRATNDRTRAATEIIQAAWSEGLAAGPGKQSNPFDEGIERLWVRQWLFYANSVRLSAAMAGADYGVFANGRWWLADNLRQLHDHWKLLKSKER